MEETIVTALGNLGVPAAVCFYTLFVVNKSLNNLTIAINKLSEKVDKVDRLEKEIVEMRYYVYRGLGTHAGQPASDSTR